MNRNQHFWTEADVASLAAATSFAALVPIALAVLGRMKKVGPIDQVCGPISTGGQGTIPKNLAVFNATIDKLIQQKFNVFDQVPFEEPMNQLKGKGAGSQQNNQLLNDFYLPIFQSGLIYRLNFIHDWQSSEGATWEREKAQQLGIVIKDLPQDFVTL